jgi:alpha-mannosidase
VHVPASGLASIRIAPAAHAPEPGFVPATAAGRTLANGQVEVAVAADGTLDVTGADGTVLRGLGRLVDGGDRGDSYNYGPPAKDLLVSEPVEVAVEVLEQGPLRARTRVTRVYHWPAALTQDRDVRSAQTVPTPVETLVELRAGEPFVRLTTSFLNRSADHRLRLHVPLPGPVAGSASAGQFAVTPRGLTAEGGWGEHPIPTFPASQFVTAGPATVLLDHSAEYEVVGDGTELAVTLLRAIGSISVNIHPYRDEPAASEIPAPGAQDLGLRIENRLAVLPSADGWQQAGAVAAAELFRNDVLVARGTAPAGGALPADTAGIAVDGPDVFVSAIRKATAADGTAGTEVRLVAMSDTAVRTRVSGAFTEARTVDLLGRPLSAPEPAPGALDLDLGPWEIRTVLLR